MGAPFVTAVEAFLDIFIGLVAREYGDGSGASKAPGSIGKKWGMNLRWGDMLLLFTACTSLSVGTGAVRAEVLETGPRTGEELRKTAMRELFQTHIGHRLVQNLAR